MEPWTATPYPFMYVYFYGAVIQPTCISQKPSMHIHQSIMLHMQCVCSYESAATSGSLLKTMELRFRELQSFRFSFGHLGRGFVYSHSFLLVIFIQIAVYACRADCSGSE